MDLPLIDSTRQCTIVSFHAHPDDEALFTGGTLARAAAEGHRVVLVVATAGEYGLAHPERVAATGSAHQRLLELSRSAAALGCARALFLGYVDSGMTGQPSPATDGLPRFVDVAVEAAAGRLAAILREEDADILTTYDQNGGYGHPDHVQVHRVGARAAELAGTPLVLQATIDRTLMDRALWCLRRLRWLTPGLELPAGARLFAARSTITHRIDVRAHTTAKRAAMAMHVSQQTASSGTRTISLLLKLPTPLGRRVLGTEWFVQAGTVPPDTPASTLSVPTRSQTQEKAMRSP